MGNAESNLQSLAVVIFSEIPHLSYPKPNF
jgi:hypothetical protein